MSAAASDQSFLHRALELARRGIALASPNPYVGAVIVDAREKILGEGIYTYAGKKHAEILALEQAGERARGATLYINLEPHGHQGRTPPCTDRLIQAGIRRVVASMEDPNPKVSGRGFEQLRAAGIVVSVGGMQEQAQRLNEAFARYIRCGIPLVTLKAAMTLDGKIAPSPTAAVERTEGVPCGGWITGEAARGAVQELRHRHDALLVGVGTVLADNPLLTDRSGQARRRPLLRVIVDSQLRLSPDSRLVKDARARQESDILVFCGSADRQKQARLETFGVRVERASALEPGERPSFPAILRRLGELEITSLMIEGGATVNGAALGANAVDRAFLFYAPKVLGDTGSIPFSVFPGGTALTQPIRLTHIQLHRFGQDLAVEGYLRDPYAG
jgi:diaminohydroxyphosphoribosylaminopyrimidine deaminase / 5-amino-6-(5-phosphoribosylamino)uracil reductase